MLAYVILAGRILALALLFLFLIAVMRTGIGLVKGQNKKIQGWHVTVLRGPSALRGVNIAVSGPIVVGRSPGCDIVIPGTFVSSTHARFSPLGDNLVIEDLGSTNGTVVNGEQISAPYTLTSGDVVSIGEVQLKVSYN
jgi:pSer/pThr/pTyr-binding forkhead associated (FHA) protein